MVQDPHNSFFAFVFGKVEHAAELLRVVLPGELSRRLDWGSLERKPGSFVDGKLRWLHSDLLFSVRTKGAEGGAEEAKEILVYALFEHQSRPDVLMAYRVWRYLGRICDEHLKAHRGQKVPLVVPIVIYNGREAWSAARTLRGLMDAPAGVLEALGGCLPECGYLLVDLRHGEAERLLDEALTGLGRAAIRAMAVALDDERFFAEIGRMAEALDDVVARAGDGAMAALEALLRYLSATHEKVPQGEIVRALGEALDPEKAAAMTTNFDRWLDEKRAEARAQGRAQGRVQGRVEVLLDLLAVKFGEVPQELERRVKDAPADDILAWSRRVLTARTIEETIGTVDGDPKTTTGARAARGKRTTPRPARRSAKPRS